MRGSRAVVRFLADLASHWYFFDPAVRERLGRQDFFAAAFKALRFNGIGGDYAEFGTAGGMTFALAYHEARRYGHGAKFWAFDSFAGFPPSADPAEHPRWIPGKMKTGLDEFHAICARNGIPREAYEVVPGFYEQSLRALGPDGEPRDIALAYVDCDLYASTRAVLQFLRPRLKHGMLVAFDDYFCWSASQLAGERRALLELQAEDDRWHWLPYKPFGWHGMSFVVEDRRLAAS